MNLDSLQGDDVVSIARNLLGHVLCTSVNNRVTKGIITETEAYSYRERGCHAYAGKRTPRTDIMFAPGGHIYVYLCYGIHHLINIVTNKQERAEAVLLRAIQPLEGMEIMRGRRQTNKDKQLCNGPGKLCEAMGIDKSMNGLKLNHTTIWVERGIRPRKIQSTPRIGIDYAGEDAKLPWRFLANS